MSTHVPNTPNAPVQRVICQKCSSSSVAQSHCRIKFSQRHSLALVSAWQRRDARSSSHHSTNESPQSFRKLTFKQTLLSSGFLAIAAVNFASCLPVIADDLKLDVATGSEVVFTGENESKADEAPQQVYLDVSVDGQRLGRVTIQVFQDVPIGSQRFMQLASGIDGASYRRSKFDAITPQFVRNAGVRELTYRADSGTRLSGGSDTFALLEELDGSRHTHSAAGMVSLVVKEAGSRPVKEKLVAYKGKFVTVQETLGGEVPNGTAFVITLDAAPALDATHLVVGRVASGMEVVEKLAQLPVVKENKNSPFFQAAKTFGDKRADVAERAFGRPFGKVLISDAGLLQQ